MKQRDTNQIQLKVQFLHERKVENTKKTKEKRTYTL